MPFDIQGFVRTNKVVLIWAAFFGLIYLIVSQGLFGVVFITFILCFIFNNFIEHLYRRFRAPRRLLTVIIYLLFLTLLMTVIYFVVPKLGSESRTFLKKVPRSIEQIHIYLDKLAVQQPNLVEFIDQVKEYLSLKSLVGLDVEGMVLLAFASFNQLTHYVTYFVLGTLLSFLILFDYPSLRSKAIYLRETRLREFYEETAESVIQFALVVGKAFQAQILIACANTILTGLGLWILGIHPIALLLTIVFFAGLIPVLGVFISSLPILIVAINSGGMQLALAALCMIVFVHLVEAYILNPRIFSAVFHINTVVTLGILFVGHSLMGLWGMLLGMPISVYVYRYVILGGETARRPPKKKLFLRPGRSRKKEGLVQKDAAPGEGGEQLEET
jgi:predicted PurR-regulated permease PerM